MEINKNKEIINNKNVDGNESKKSFLNLFGQKIPKNTFLFFTQAILVYIVVIISLINLSIPKDDAYKKDDKLWIALLSSSVGYLLPNPSLKVIPQ